MTADAPDDDRTALRPTTAAGDAVDPGFQTTAVYMQPTQLNPAAASGAAAAAAPDLDLGNGLPIGTRLGEFEITALVGEGGFGIVYQAIDHSLGRRVALKEYMPSSLASRTASQQVQVKSERYRETFEAGRKSFVNEARLLASFDHPSLVRVYRFWEGNGTAYMVMPFLEGKTLKDILRERKQAGLPAPDEAWLRSVLGPLTEALQVIHGEQCYHRDIAPDNVMQLPDGRWLLLDFGAARRVIGDMTQALTVILKPGYAPIEQYAEIPHMKQGAWTDVYALAAVVYFAIMGRTPPPAVGRMLTDSYVPLATAAAGRYGAAFLEAVDRALAVRPEQRPQTIGELRQLLGLDGAAAAARAVAPAAGSPAATVPPAPRPAAAPAAARPPERPAAAPAPAARQSPAAAAPRRSGLAIGIGAAVLAGVGVGLYLAFGAAPAPTGAPAATVAASPAPATATAPAAPAPAASAAPPSSPPATAAFDALRELERVVVGQTGGFGVRAEAARTELRIGRDEFRFSVTPDRDGFLTVLGLGPEGTLAQIVPNKRSGTVKLRKGQAWRFPAADGFALETQDPPGPTQLLVIVSSSPRSHEALRLETAGPIKLFPAADVMAGLAAAHAGPAPLLAGRADCDGAAACPEEYGAALLRFETVR